MHQELAAAFQLEDAQGLPERSTQVLCPGRDPEADLLPGPSFHQSMVSRHASAQAQKSIFKGRWLQVFHGKWVRSPLPPLCQGDVLVNGWAERQPRPRIEAWRGSPPPLKIFAGWRLSVSPARRCRSGESLTASSRVIPPGRANLAIRSTSP